MRMTNLKYFNNLLLEEYMRRKKRENVLKLIK